MKLWNFTQSTMIGNNSNLGNFQMTVIKNITLEENYQTVDVNHVNPEYGRSFRPFLALALVAGGSASTFAILATRNWPRPVAATISLMIGFITFFLLMIPRPADSGYLYE